LLGRVVPGVTPDTQRRLRGFFAFVQGLSDSLAARIALLMFCTPPRRKLDPADAPILERASRSTLRCGKDRFTIFRWEHAGPPVVLLHGWGSHAARFADFVYACQMVIPASYQQLLNITLRYVNSDRDSVMAYAPEPRIAAVLLFSQEKTARAEADMARMTRTLIEQVLDLGGTYYLPYRPHASLDQLSRGYPRAQEFAATKRAVDRDLLFRNQLWDGYLAKL